MNTAHSSSREPNRLVESRRGGDRRTDQQARLELAIDASGVGMWDWHRGRDAVLWDDRTCHIFGVAQGTVLDYDGFLELLEPTHRERTHQLLMAALDPMGSGEFGTECRVCHSNAEGRIVAVRGRALFAGAGAERHAIRLLGTALDITERLRAESEREGALVALRDSEQRYALAARATENAIWDWDVMRGTLHWSEGVERVFGHPMHRVPRTIEWWYAQIHPDDRARVERGINALVDCAGAGNAWSEAYRFCRADDTYANVVDRGYIARDEGGRAVRMIGAMEDETEREQLQERLRQAQRMEAVGQLAGGVAHDFNNLLTVIAGNLEFAQSDLPSDSPVRGDLQEIASATERARALVRQLLAFSRKQELKLESLDLSDIVRGAEQLLRRVIGEEIVLEVHLANDLPMIRADRGQMEQVLMNLAVNARDAMLTPAHGHAGRGGSLLIETTYQPTTAQRSAADEGPTGPMVSLRVRDTGHGMNDMTQRHVFEPFFTTKEVGAGTGLGLATVFGIVRQFGGGIAVQSAPGAGTAFTLRFPVAASAVQAERVVVPAIPPSSSRAMVLLVEDESAVRSAARRMLERKGYSVLEARHGADALLVWHEHRERIDLVVTDLRMPEMGGHELVTQLRKEEPGLPVVFMSGYADQASEAVHFAHSIFVEKPFTMEILLSSVQRLLQLHGDPIITD